MSASRAPRLLLLAGSWLLAASACSTSSDTGTPSGTATTVNPVTSAAPTTGSPGMTATRGTTPAPTTTADSIDGSGPRGGARTPCSPTPDTEAFKAGVTCRNLIVDGYPREFLVYVPQAVAADPGAPAPLVTMYHGSSGTG